MFELVYLVETMNLNEWIAFSIYPGTLKLLTDLSHRICLVYINTILIMRLYIQSDAYSRYEHSQFHSSDPYN